MLNYIEYLNLPLWIAIGLVGLFLIMQIIGEILEFKGKVVPEFIKIRKRFARKRQERETLKVMPETLNEVKTLLSEVNQHYNADNITKRDGWIQWVNDKAGVYDSSLGDLDKKIDSLTYVMTDLIIDTKRNTIINFASKVADDSYPVTREQFNRVFKEYKEYEDIIEKNGRTNGEVDIAIRIIQESYEKHTKNHSFIEDVRGYK